MIHKTSIFNFVVFVLILITAGTVAALYTQTWNPMWNPFRPEPDKVIEEMITKLEELKTYHADLNFQYKTEDKDEFSFEGKFKIDQDNTDLQNIKSAMNFEITPGLEGMKFYLKGESRTIGQTTYLKLTTLPALPFLEFPLGMMGIDISAIENQWIKIDPQSYKDLMWGMGRWSPEMEAEFEKSAERQKGIQEKILDLIKGRRFYLIKEELPDEKIEDQPAYHYIIALDKKELKELIPELLKILAQTNQIKDFTGTVFERFPEKMREFLEKIDEISAEIWIGKKDKLPYRIRGEKEIDLSKFESGETGKIIFKMDINFSNFDQPVKIEAPEKFRSLSELLPPFYSALFFEEMRRGRMEEEILKKKVPEKEVIVPPGAEQTEFEIFSQDIAYRGSKERASKAYLPIRFLLIPEEIKIYKIEGYLEAYNWDPTYSRSVGIAIGSSIPIDCQAKYYIGWVNSNSFAEKKFNLDPALLEPGINQITAWISTYEKLAGENSWVSLKLVFSYLGDSPRLLKEETVLTEPIDPIGCKLAEKEIGEWKSYTQEKEGYKYEIKYPKDWSLTARLTEPSLPYYSPRDIVNLITVRKSGSNLQDLQSVIFWFEVFDKPTELSIEKWISEGYREDLSEVKNGKGIEEALEKAYTGEKGIISYLESKIGSFNVYEVGRVWDNYFSYTKYIEGPRYIYGIGIKLPFERDEKLVSVSDSKYLEIFNQIISDFWFLEKSPVSLMITDPEGYTVSKNNFEAPGMSYMIYDMDGNRALDNIVTVPEAKIGEYKITIVPEPWALPTHTFTLKMGEITFAEDTFIKDLPDQPYRLKSTGSDFYAFPIAKVGGPYSGKKNQPIFFDGSSSYDPDGNIVLYEWDFDNDGKYDMSSASSTISFTWSESYTGVISLRITDDDGLTTKSTAEVKITD